MLRSAGGYPASLSLIVALLGESALTAYSLGDGDTWLCSLAEFTLVPWWTEQLDRFRQLIIAPVFDVGEDTCGVLITAV